MGGAVCEMPSAKLTRNDGILAAVESRVPRDRKVGRAVVCEPHATLGPLSSRPLRRLFDDEHQTAGLDVQHDVAVAVDGKSANPIRCIGGERDRHAFGVDFQRMIYSV